MRESVVHLMPADSPRLGEDFVDAVQRALSSGAPDSVSDADLERVFTAAVKLYAAKVERDNAPETPIAASAVTPTDVVVVVSDMMRAAGLNLWDVSMWFNRRQGRGKPCAM
jgi:hypothetical protein